MDDYPAKIADFLEETAAKVRSLTVDRIAYGVRWATAGIVLAVIAFLLILFLLFGLFRLFGELIGVELTYAVFGGLFVIAGALLWSRRTPKPTQED